MVEVSEPRPTLLHVRVTGMTCAGCVAHVKQALLRVEGVRDARVNLAMGEAGLALDAPVPGQRIRDAVAGAGYGTEARFFRVPADETQKEGLLALAGKAPGFLSGDWNGAEL
ncbi:MAG: heavy-metal-associated domain-containing protein, partial [Planctomycetota bacterium]